MARNTFNKIIGYRIGYVRSKHKESQPKLRDALGITSRETVTQWENGKREPKASDIRAIAERYDVSADFLLGILPDGVMRIEGDVKVAQVYTGLSDKALDGLNARQSNKDIERLWFISRMLEDNRFNSILDALYDTIDFYSETRAGKTMDSAGIRFYADLAGIDLKDVFIHKIVRSYEEIVEDIIDEKLKGERG